LSHTLTFDDRGISLSALIWVRLIGANHDNQADINAYDDMWLGANMLHCTDFHPADGTSWTETCQWSKATVTHLPEVLKYYPVDSQQNAFSLFRTLVYKEADETYAAVLGSAQSSIDAIHVNFSLELICIANLIGRRSMYFRQCLTLDAGYYGCC
jgi:hypothetical protein